MEDEKKNVTEIGELIGKLAGEIQASGLDPYVVVSGLAVVLFAEEHYTPELVLKGRYKR